MVISISGFKNGAQLSLFSERSLGTVDYARAGGGSIILTCTFFYRIFSVYWLRYDLKTKLEYGILSRIFPPTPPLMSNALGLRIIDISSLAVTRAAIERYVSEPQVPSFHKSALIVRKNGVSSSSLEGDIK